MIKVCLVCKKDFKTSHKRTKYCSKRCYLIDRISKHLVPKTAFKKGMTSWNKGKKLGFVPKCAFKKGMVKSKNAYTFPKGKNNLNWKGGKIIDKDSYVLVLKPNHPFCNSLGYVREHRLVMEKHLGRYLLPEEVVHHNGTKYRMGSIKDKQDNRIENLKLFADDGEHCKFHRRLCRNILTREGE